MFAITKSFKFESAHSLPHLPVTHKCHGQHGHSYEASFVLESEDLDEDGMVEDFRRLDDVKHMIDTRLDHHDLNVVLGPMMTTSENLARYLYWWAKAAHPKLVAVIVSETDSSSAEYREE